MNNILYTMLFTVNTVKLFGSTKSESETGKAQFLAAAHCVNSKSFLLVE